MRNLPSLTGLRGVAALWVMAYHVSQLASAMGANWIGHVPLLSAGWVGVDLFFVLSGFILMWVHGEEFAAPTAATVRHFAAMRLVRVYPLSLAVLGLIALMVWADPSFAVWFKAKNPDNLSLSAFVRTAALATRWVGASGGDWNQPVWSLSAELVGYAAFPLLAWGLARRAFGTAMIIAVTSLAAFAGFQSLAGIVGVNTIDQVSALTRMACCFTAGIAICRMRQAAPGWGARFAGLGAVALCLTLVAALQMKAGFIVAPVVFAALIFALSFQSGIIDRALSSAPAVFLGKISFPLYLVHLMPLQWMVSHIHGAGQAAATGYVAAYAALCLAAAYLLHRVVERPAHHWARGGFAMPSLFRGRLSPT